MKILSNEEIKEHYSEMFESIFGEKPKGQIPRVVIANDDYTGFISGYAINNNTFYISWGGVKNGFISVKKLWMESEKELANAGIKWLVTRIINVDTVAQRLVLGIGFVPAGISASGTHLYIEYHKRMTGE